MVRQILAQDVKAKLDAGEPLHFLDVRQPEEYARYNLGGVLIPLGELMDNLDKIDRQHPVVIHCQSGARAAIAYSLLAKNGYKNVLNYSGGMNEWINEGNPIVS